MKVLVSPVSLEEARLVVAGGADILDIKNVREGSLGAHGPWVVRDIFGEFRSAGMICSATLGDLPFKPGTAALAAFGLATCGADYIKAGLHGVKDYEEARELMQAVVRAVRMVSEDILVVAAGYADAARFGGVGYRDIVRAAADAGADVVMLDTAIKDGKGLFDALTREQVQEFVDLSRAAGLLVALAGSVKKGHMPLLAQIGPDIVGVRGAVCENEDRTRGITEASVRDFMADTRRLCPDPGPALPKRRAAATA